MECQRIALRKQGRDGMNILNTLIWGRGDLEDWRYDFIKPHRDQFLKGYEVNAET